MSTTSLCNACKKSVSNRNALTCSLCQQDVHPKCNDLNYVDSQMIKNLNKLWYCLNCCQEVFPFTSINNYKLHTLLSSKRFCDFESTDTCLILNSPKNLTHLFNEINNLSPDNEDCPDERVNCKYYDINQIQKLKSMNNKNSLSLFHLNTCSLSRNFEEFAYLLNSTKSILMLLLFQKLEL